MNDILFKTIPSLQISRATISDFEQAFRNLRPKITTQGNSVKIQQKGQLYIIPLSQPNKSSGFTR